METEDIFTTCRQKDDWFAFTMQQDPEKHEFPATLMNFSFIEDGGAFKLMGDRRKFANDTKFVEKITVTPSKVRIALSREVTSKTPLTLFRVRPECRLAFLDYIADRPDLAAKLEVQDHDG